MDTRTSRHDTATSPGEPIALDAEACRQLLAISRLGRIGLTDRALPMILPLGFAIEGDDLVFRIGTGLILDAARRGNVACFQVDCSDERLDCGWSVTAIGTLALVTDPAELDRLGRLPLPTWSASASNFVRMCPAMLSGRSRCRLPFGAAG